VSNLPALTELDLSFSNVTDQALQALRSLRTLTSLNLYECENVTAAGVQALRNTTVSPSLQIEFHDEYDEVAPPH
jgi:Leucine-rich repeat (LRR) protein